MEKILSIRDFRVQEKRVFLRCDLNVPLNEKGDIKDDFRIQETVPTIEYLINLGAKVIVATHLGDPEGKVVETLKTDKIQEKLRAYLEVPVSKAQDCVGREVEEKVKTMVPGEVLVLENLRFHREEQLNDVRFAKQLARLGDFYINDAFGVCHRAHASVVGVPRFLPSGMGLLLEKEISVLDRVRGHPQKPIIVIIGGKKVESKLSLIDTIGSFADLVLLGNLLSEEALRKRIIFTHAKKILFPVDGVRKGSKILDIGPHTRKLYREKIMGARTIIWSGPLGKVEEKKYGAGSLEIAKAIKESKAFSVAGGGNLLAFLNAYHLRDYFSHVSTGGGAMLSYLAGEKLPGLEALKANTYGN